MTDENANWLRNHGQDFALDRGRSSAHTISDRLADAQHQAQHVARHYHDVAHLDRHRHSRADRCTIGVAVNSSGSAGKLVAAIPEAHLGGSTLAALSAGAGHDRFGVAVCLSTGLARLVVFPGAISDVDFGKPITGAYPRRLASEFRMGASDPDRRSRRRRIPAPVLLP